MAIYPTEAVTIDLGDGQERELRYTLATMRRLKKLFGESVMTGAALQSIDEDKLPEMLFEGLVDREGIADAEALAGMIRLGAVPYLVQQFTAAFTGAFPVPDPAKNAQSSLAN